MTQTNEYFTGKVGPIDEYCSLVPLLPPATGLRGGITWQGNWEYCSHRSEREDHMAG